ncbi:MAG TPA: iron chelate uptake ABC transporter family permease subunit, partial [Arthrobacter sp.]|nr:iron chelate uptake ABC transporter family permease subunit [Arthrobacter sp.]
MFAVYVLLGSYTVTIPDFFKILIAHLSGGERIPGASFIVMENKLPRAVIGIMIGTAFGLSGGLFQTMLRNPLASPDVIGISYGASAAAVTAIVVFGATGPAVSAAALVGALGIAALIYAISRGPSLGTGGGGGNAAGSRLILAGVGIAAALHAVVNFLMTRADIRTAADALVWLNGSLNS